MTSTQKRGFRLPWGLERLDGGESVLDPATIDASEGVAGDELGDGPARPADDPQDMTTDAAPAAADVPDKTAEAAMFDAEGPNHESAAAPPDTAGDADGGWPSADRRGQDRRAEDRPFMSDSPADRADGERRLPRRDNPLVAGLVKAMREAAIASRDETSARLTAEASARIETIRARATSGAADLRTRLDEDVSAIREWSKAEMARVRQQTDDRIEARKAELAGETERHAASVDRLVEEVQTTVSAFEAETDKFFTQLLAETDPARLATLAEQAPDPPDLSGDGPSATDLVDGPADGLHADAAAEAEAEASEGLDPSANEAWSTAAPAAPNHTEPDPIPADANGPNATRLLVSGLVSVAGISAFKGALAQLAGVHSVSVSSGEKGVFVFSVNHDPGVDLDSGLASLAGFAAHITDATNDGFTVDAHEPAA